jgi:GAF domain-containing protein
MLLSLSACSPMTISLFTHPPLPENEAARQQAVFRSGLLQRQGDHVLMEIVNAARRVAGTRSAALTILSEDSQHVIAATGRPMGVSRRSTSFGGHLVGEDLQVLSVIDAALDERFVGNPYVEDGIIRFYTGVPIEDRDGFKLGVLCVFDPTPRAELTDEQRARIQELAQGILSAGLPVAMRAA